MLEVTGTLSNCYIRLEINLNYEPPTKAKGLFEYPSVSISLSFDSQHILECRSEQISFTTGNNTKVDNTKLRSPNPIL